MKRQVDAAHGRFPHEAARLQRDGQGAGVDAVPVLRDIPADHGADQGRAVELHRFAGQHEAAVAQDRDAVGQCEDLGHAVRDVDDADAVRPQASHDVEQPLLLCPPERRCRLVEDKDLGSLCGRPRDLDHLALARGQAPGAFPRVETDPEPVEDALRLRDHRAPVEP